MIQVLHDTTPKARKRHSCDSCMRIIEPGETYRRQDNVGDDGRYAWKACAHCDALFEHVYATDPYARYYDDGIDLHEWLTGHADPLLPTFRAKWQVFGALAPVPAWPDPTANERPER